MAIEDWTRVASVDDFKPGVMKPVVVGDDDVLLANINGEVLAASDICTHEFVLLHDGFLEDDEVECPQHGSKFDLRSGKVRGLPATQPLPVYEVKVEGDEIYIRGPK